MSVIKESESVARVNASVQLNVCRAQMYGKTDADANKDIEAERDVLIAELVKLRESVAKSTDFQDKWAVFLNNAEVLRRRIGALVKLASAIDSDVSVIRKEYLDLARACLGARDAEVGLGVWSFVNVPQESPKRTSEGTYK